MKWRKFTVFVPFLLVTAIELAVTQTPPITDSM